MSGKLRYEWQNNLPTSLFYSRSREKTYPFILGWVHPAHSLHSPLLVADVVSLLFSFKRENTPSWELQKWVANWDMSADYTCTPSPHPSPFVRPYFLSWVVVQERKLYTRHYTPFLGTPEMSGKLRYESQIILRYFTLIIYEVSLERPTIQPW